MIDTIHKKDSKQEKLTVFDYAMEAIGWLQIVASPLLGGLVVGGVVYLWIGNTTGLVIGICLAVVGLVAGIVLANRVWKNRGTIDLMSRVNASPELDRLEPLSEQDKRHTTLAFCNRG
jgi:hypothetical protein